MADTTTTRTVRHALLALALCAAPAFADWGTDFNTSFPFTLTKRGTSSAGAATTNFAADIIENGDDDNLRLSVPGGSVGQANLIAYINAEQTFKDMRVRALVNKSGGENLTGLPGVVARYNATNGACYALVVDFTLQRVILQRWGANAGSPTVLANISNPLINTNTPVIVELLAYGNSITANVWNDTNTQILVSQSILDNTLATGTGGACVSARFNGSNVATSIPSADIDDLSVIAAIKDADLNRDGFDDIFWRNQATGNQGVWLLGGANIIGWSGLAYVGDLNWTMITSGDFSQDGIPDILWQNNATGELGIWRMAANGTLIEFASIGAVPAGWKAQAVADMNRDGNVDIFFRNTSTGENGLWLMNGMNFKAWRGVSFVGDLGWNVEASGDYNRDGSPDLVWRNRDTGAVAFWLMNGSSLMEFLPFTFLTTDWQIIGSGDFNNDSLMDILWRNNTTNLVATWYLTGTTYSNWSAIEFIPDVNWKGVN